MSARVWRIDRLGPVVLVADEAAANSVPVGSVAAWPTAEGFLRARAPMARDGLLQYGDGRDTWYEYRPREELAAAAPSFALVLLTDDHPDDFVDPDNARDLFRGMVASDTGVEVGTDDVGYLVGTITVADRDALAKVKAGCELSIGFSTVVTDEAGEIDGVPYRHTQRDLEGNHLALVDRGRAGPRVRFPSADARAILRDSAITTRRLDHQGAHAMKNGAGKRTGAAAGSQRTADKTGASSQGAATGAAASTASSPASRSGKGDDEREDEATTIEISGVMYTVDQEVADYIASLQAQLEAMQGPAEPAPDAAAVPAAAPARPTVAAVPAAAVRAPAVAAPARAGDGAARAAADAAAQRQADADFSNRVSARVALERDALEVLTRIEPRADGRMPTDDEVRVDVAKAVFPKLASKLDAELKAGHGDYIRAIFDQALTHYRDSRPDFGQRLGDARARGADSDDPIASITKKADSGMFADEQPRAAAGGK